MSVWKWMEENLLTSVEAEKVLGVSRFVLTKLKRGGPVGIRSAKRIEQNSKGYFKAKDLVRKESFEPRKRKMKPPKEDAA